MVRNTFSRDLISFDSFFKLYAVYDNFTVVFIANKR